MNFVIPKIILLKYKWQNRKMLTFKFHDESPSIQHSQSKNAGTNSKRSYTASIFALQYFHRIIAIMSFNRPNGRPLKIISTLSFYITHMAYIYKYIYI